MRQAGTLPSKQDAERFADYLLTLGIGSKIDPSAEQWTIWILDENQVPRSKQELQQYLQQPRDSRYLAAERDAKVTRREAAERTKQAQKNYVDMRQQWSRLSRGRVTIALIAASVLVGVLTDFGNNMDPVGTDLKFWMPAIEQGQVWRLLTPIFLHGGLLHLIFNMWWLYDLGNLIERRIGWWRFAALALVIALASNCGQYMASGPNFVGMSGVVFGLFGYAWVRGRLDPTSGMYLRPDIVVLMMLWFGACLIGMVPNVANAAHGVGLAVGAAIGYLPEIRKFLNANT
jgi:GlpG protein